MKILYVTSEAVPFMATGGLADVAGSLPKALNGGPVSCRVVMPLYGGIKQEFREKMEFITDITVPVGWRQQYCGIFSTKLDGVTFYFLDNEYYFKRDGIYGHYDDGERFAFFSRAVPEILPVIDYKPDIIHCNDWQSALVPVYYSVLFAENPDFAGIKTIFTIHNIQYQGVYGHSILGDVFGLPAHSASLLDFSGALNLMKGAIECADRVTTVSKTYAKEIMDPWFSHGLDSILRQRSYKVSGILNGIDFVNYDPAKDKVIFENYSAKKLEGKAKNKTELQKLLKLEIEENKPLMGIISRLVSHKGLDLIMAVLDDIVYYSDIQLAVLGSGDKKYEDFFHSVSSRYPGRVSFTCGFVPDLARKIYAGSDMFLMPSKSEPCGLSQMLALRYGSIPIVRETGGLKDSVTDSGDGAGNGFTFKSYNADDMKDAVYRTLEKYKDKEGWQKLKLRALKCDNSWAASAKEYRALYNDLLK